MTLKPKMLIFSHVSNPSSITGAEKLLLFFCGQMAPYFDCVLVAPNEGRLTLLARQSGIVVKIYKTPLLYSIYTPDSHLMNEADKLLAAPAFRALMKWIASERPQVILTNTCVHFMPAAAGKRLGIPVVWQLTEKITENGNAHLSASLIHQYSSWIISISESVAESFPPEVRQSKMTILPPSWSEADMLPEAWPAWRASYRENLGIASNRPLIGMISSFLIESKGVHHFIDMALSLKDAYPDAIFLIVGSVLDADYERLCRDRIAWSGAQHRFIFAGTQDDITQVYCALDVVVVPSLIPEGFGLTALEGLLYGKPVAAYASGGLQEVLTSAGCPHLLAEPGNPASLAEKVRFILDQPDQGAALGMLNRVQAQAVFGPGTYQLRVNGMVSRWMNEYPGWFQAKARSVKDRAAPARRHKLRRRSRKKPRLFFTRPRTRRTEGRSTRRRASKLRQRRTSARRRRA
ncbi:GDP-mannose-dependent alpha-(1-6)-phosphatidylinositol monomannoside mannosyltransferase [Actinobacillus pleuropneumoniae]|nr:GDP-mannose-dependent alpha-(1-6)-phosphatidylinositol monomannoside mannosyltransferase [Actinobacillus pleuropneumoniae]